MPVKHAFTSGKADGGDATLVQPSNWNADHTITDIVATVAGTPLTVTNPILNGTNSVNGFTQLHVTNKSNGTSASSDFVATTDTGTDSAEFIDMGINGSGWTGSTWGGAKDGYLYVEGGASGVGDLFIGTAQPNTVVQINAGSGSNTASNGAKFTTTYQAIYNATLEERLGGVIWTKTSPTTLSNFTTAASIIGAVGTGVGTLTLPANFLTVGRTLRLRMYGVYGTTTTAPTLNFLVSLGGVTLATSGALSMTTASMTNRPWMLELEITCRATGSTATVIANGMVQGQNTLTAQNSWLLVGTAAVNVDTATTNDLAVTVACGTANNANTITCHHATLEVIG